MTFACQRDSYLQQLVSKVVSSVPLPGTNLNLEGKEVFEVTCEDTILFPEGGGQNSDHGTLGEGRVLSVRRQGSTAVHLVQAEPETAPQAGQELLQVVDWPRRFDNMQQHTGQHLISALAESKLNITTNSWWMAENSNSKPGISFVELNVENIDKEQIHRIEELCNGCIRQNLSVEIKVYSESDKELEKSKTRGLPDDHSGPIRVIEIEGIDSNMCCGTHVSSLGQLQMIKLLHVEKQKKQNSTKLFFLVGDRVIRYFSLMYERERNLSGLLRGGPSDHELLVSKLSGNVKSLQKSVEVLAKEAAVKDAKILKDQKPQYFISHRSELSSENATSNFSQVVLYSPDDKFLELTERISNALEASFHVKDKWMYGKFSDIKKLPLADEILRKHYDN